MEVAMNETTPKEKKGFWNAFVTFLSMGGFLVILVAVVAVVILISYLTK
jgi:heme/copper-type cytochrome/quinol oxidase subunit 2